MDFSSKSIDFNHESTFLIIISSAMTTNPVLLLHYVRGTEKEKADSVRKAAF